MSSEFKMMSYGKIKYQCPCCGCFTYDNKPTGDFSICPVCFWEDDSVQEDDPEYEGGANDLSLVECRRNYERFGACEERFCGRVRKPLPEEME